mgnify:CR=1 FL=1
MGRYRAEKEYITLTPFFRRTSVRNTEVFSPKKGVCVLDFKILRPNFGPIIFYARISRIQDRLKKQ